MGDMALTVGTPITLTYFDGSRMATTVVASEPGVVYVTEDLSVRTDENGISEDQTYAYTPVPDGPRLALRRHQGVWRVHAPGTGRHRAQTMVGVRSTYVAYNEGLLFLVNRCGQAAAQELM